MECESVGRGDGRGGGIRNGSVERFRRGKGSVWPVVSISTGTLYGRRFVIDMDCGAKLLEDFVNIVAALGCRLVPGFLDEVDD